MCTPFRSADVCGPFATPPKTQTHSTGGFMHAPASEQTSAVCTASSRVGDITSMTGCLGLAAPVFFTWSNPGSPNPSVLPDPVDAMPMQSAPDKMMGNTCA